MASAYVQDHAGRDFDQFLDWDGNADGSSSSTSPKAEQSFRTPPSSSPETSVALTNATFTQRPSDLPTPSNSNGSGSPEVQSASERRSSGEGLHEKVRGVTRPILKRKLSPQDVPTLSYTPSFSIQPLKKRPHNVIEKRYRANLNEKIGELRDSVPSLRVLKKSQDGEQLAGSDDDNLDGLVPTNKLNKASVLTKAVEYIRHLETRNKRLEDENRLLKERMQTLDKVLASGDGAGRATAFTSATSVESAASPSPNNAENAASDEERRKLHPPQGLIPVPESMRRLREAQPQEHYGHIYENTASSRKWPQRLVLGSLAGLMIMEGFGESDQGTQSREKGLFGIPLELLDGWQFLQSPSMYLRAFSQFCSAGGALPLMKGFAALSILAFFIFTYLFHSKPIATPVEESEKPRGAPSLASPIEVRRRAWSTSMQALSLPHHNFVEEWMAVTSEWLAYSIRLLFGGYIYSMVTGRNCDDETARTKAWDIAVDAQLTGGDPEVSRSRVVLTCFGSGTLPASPLRLMLKALHGRVLLWRMGEPGSVASQALNKLARHYANREWLKARQLNSELMPTDPDQLPLNLTTLVNEDCDEVFNDAVIQRAYNLMYDRPTGEHGDDIKDALMNVVVEDHAVRSALDAIGSWWSSQSLRRALVCSLENSAGDYKLSSAVELELLAALHASPPGSAADTRALALHAVFFSRKRHDFYLRAMNALPQAYDGSGSTTPRSGIRGPYFIDSSTPASACPEIRILLHCAMTMGILESQEDTEEAITHFSTLSIKPDDLTLLSFSAIYFVLRQFSKAEPSSISITFAPLVQMVCSWLHTESPTTAQMPLEVVEQIDNMCFLSAGSWCKRRGSTLSKLSKDSGYESMEERTSPPSGASDLLSPSKHVSWV